jgi:DNA-binding transcriptional LysR family regulator
VVVAAPGHALAETPGLAPAVLEAEPWCVGPGGVQEGTVIRRFLTTTGIAPADVRAFPSDAAALSAVAAGDGVMLTLSHAALPGLRRGAIVRLDVRGTPVQDQWFASTLDEASCLTAALTLRRFATSADAVHAIAATRRGVPAAKVRPAVHATLWRSVPTARG